MFSSLLFRHQGKELGEHDRDVEKVQIGLGLLAKKGVVHMQDKQMALLLAAASGRLKSLKPLPKCSGAAHATELSCIDFPVSAFLTSEICLR